MRIITNDSSALIDLAKTRLLENLLRLPYRFVIPDVLYADELINLRHYQREQLLDIGFVLGELDGVQVGKTSEYNPPKSALSCSSLPVQTRCGSRLGLRG
ncbi:MAG: PIN domain-containing protein [Synechococcaceae cyanobacterium SM1_2_3]|nr:PIN domain-containing protein [Synechococcaceae cyanobacterium SM1_2_3]